jgi:hypothetical protein
MNVKSMMGIKYGRLTAVELRGRDKRGNASWLFRCDCGNEIIASGGDVRQGNTKSCGCLQKQKVSERNFKHGDARRGARTRLHRVWQGMISRCEDAAEPAYKNYGGRGIAVCIEWHDYPPFKAWALSHGYDEGLEIDRIENEGDYEPGNCRFVTRQENQRNTRRTILITIGGVTHCMTEWAGRIHRVDATVCRWVKLYGLHEAACRIEARLPRL